VLVADHCGRSTEHASLIRSPLEQKRGTVQLAKQLLREPLKRFPGEKRALHPEQLPIRRSGRVAIRPSARCFERMDWRIRCRPHPVNNEKARAMLDAAFGVDFSWEAPAMVQNAA